MRVATLNLWGRSGAWTDGQSLLVDGFRELRPDLVAFQESIKTDDYDQVSDLLGTDFQVVHQRARAADGMGVSIASRWRLGRGARGGPARHGQDSPLSLRDADRRDPRAKGGRIVAVR